MDEDNDWSFEDLTDKSPISAFTRAGNEFKGTTTVYNVPEGRVTLIGQWYAKGWSIPLDEKQLSNLLWQEFDITNNHITLKGKRHCVFMMGNLDALKNIDI